MPQLIRNRALADDRYELVRDAASLADLPDGVPVIVPLSFWLEWRGALIARGETGVWLASADHPGAMATPACCGRSATSRGTSFTILRNAASMRS